MAPPSRGKPAAARTSAASAGCVRSNSSCARRALGQAGHRDGNKPYSLFAPLCLCVRVPHSYHVVGTYTSESDATKLFLRTYFEGRADATKVVVTAFDGTGETDSADIQRAMDAAKLPCPCVGICLGEAGQLSRVINRRFTPVTSDCLPFVAAPGHSA